MSDSVYGMELTIEAQKAEIERLRKGYEDIKAATVAGRVCDDVAWFDTITTLYDFCDLMLNNGKLGSANDHSSNKTQEKS